ncbi:hypothetical protein ACWEPM_17120 [Streptomyces sp. NPDC004244]
MRPSARIPSILAGLVLSAAGIALGVPAAHADMQACEQYVAQQKVKVNSDIVQACYVGQGGDQTACVSSLQEAGVSNKAAAHACRLSPK